jgi:ankyrin repeat protein
MPNQVIIGKIENQRTPLMVAATEGDEKYLASLLKNGAHVNMTDSIGSTPLMYAAENGWTNCIKLLLNCGADPDMTDKYGNTARGLAVLRGHEKCQKLLPERNFGTYRQDEKAFQNSDQETISLSSSCSSIYTEKGDDYLHEQIQLTGEVENT